jgi:hypothetical protein
MELPTTEGYPSTIQGADVSLRPSCETYSSSTPRISHLLVIETHLARVLGLERLSVGGRDIWQVTLDCFFTSLFILLYYKY